MNSKKALLGGIKELIDGALEAKASRAKFCTRQTALALSKGDRSELDLVSLIIAMAAQIETNWINAGRQWRGKKNWRWELCPNLADHNKDPEVRLNRELAMKLDDKRWASEIPTGSGLMNPGDPETGGLDLAYCPSPEKLCLIELKNGENAENPVSAAFQIVSYALLWNLARRVHAGLVPREEPITIAEQWLTANEADLRVLVPTDHYTPFRNLAWFEKRLNDGVAAFGVRHGLRMTFGFRRFDEAPTDEAQALKALAQKVSWQ